MQLVEKKIIEKKLAKNIGLLYPAKSYLDELCLKAIYFSYIHSYLNYTNIAWASTSITKLKHYSINRNKRYIPYLMKTV